MCTEKIVLDKPFSSVARSVTITMGHSQSNLRMETGHQSCLTDAVLHILLQRVSEARYEMLLLRLEHEKVP